MLPRAGSEGDGSELEQPANHLRVCFLSSFFGATCSGTMMLPCWTSIQQPQQAHGAPMMAVTTTDLATHLSGSEGDPGRVVPSTADRVCFLSARGHVHHQALKDFRECT